MESLKEQYFDREAIGYLRLKLAIEHPNAEECWKEGYDCALHNISEDENPYKPDTLEYRNWMDGWWAGFFGETPLAAKAPVSVVSTKTKHFKLHKIGGKQDASNEPFWTHERKVLFLKRTIQITGIILVAALAYELAELVA